MEFEFTSVQYQFGVLAMVLTLIAMCSYIRGALKRGLRPQRASWLVWAVLASVSASAQTAAGTGPAIWFAASQAGGTILIACLALRSGWGHLASSTEILVIGLASCGLLMWHFTSQPGYALAISISISAFAAIPTVHRAFANPGMEETFAWALKLAGSLCAVWSTVGAPLVMQAYPLYLTLLYATVLSALALGVRRERKRQAPVVSPV